MDMSELRHRYPNKICICRPYRRDADSGRAASWICLLVVNDADAARRALKRFEEDGVTDAAPVPTGNIALEGELAARLCRIFRGPEKQAGGSIGKQEGDCL